MAAAPLVRALAEAPIDDEEETDDERTAVQEAGEAIARGEMRPWDEVRAALARRANDHLPRRM